MVLEAFVVTYAPLSNKREIKNLKTNSKTIEDNLSITDEMSAESIEIEGRSRNLYLWALKFHFLFYSIKILSCEKFPLADDPRFYLSPLRKR